LLILANRSVIRLAGGCVVHTDENVGRTFAFVNRSHIFLVASALII